MSRPTSFTFSLLHYSLITFALSFGIFLAVRPAVGQNKRETDYKADQVLKSNARVNPSTNAMELSIPISSYSGRAGNGTPITFDYSSKVWQIKFLSTWESWNGVKSDNKPLYGKRTAAGWTSSLRSPRIDWEFSMYRPFVQGSNYDGEPFSPTVGIEPDPNPPNYPIYYVKRMRIVLSDGSSHEFRKDDTTHNYGTSTYPGGPGLPDQMGTFLSVDGTRMRLERTETLTTLFMPDGGRYFFTSGDIATSYIDHNGNKTTYDIQNRRWTDTLGRVFNDPMPSNWNDFEQTQTVGDQVASFPGLSGGNYNATLSWRYLKDPNGGESGLEDTTQTLNNLSNIGCQGNVNRQISAPYLFTNPEISIARVCNPISWSGLNWWPGPPFNPVVLTKVTLANGQTYQFKYNVYGEIIKIIYPTGGFERFRYEQVAVLQPQGASYDQGNRGVVERWISPKGDGTDEIHWTYSAGLGTTYAPDGSRTEQNIIAESMDTPQPYGFGNPKTGFPYDERSYSSSGALIARKLTDYETTGPQAGGYSDAKRDVRPKRTVSIIFESGNSNALATMTETVYDTTGSTDPAYFSSLNAKQQKTYGYVAVSASVAASSDISSALAWFSGQNPVAVTEMDYLYDANYKARNINGLVTETRVKDASGNVKAKTQIIYDESGYQQTSSGTMPTAASGSWTDPLAELGLTLGAKRGQPTTVKSYHDVANGYYVETHSFYDQYGNVVKVRDGRGNDATTVFDDDYAFAYPTSATTPVPDSTGTQGANTAFTTSATFDYNTGLPLTATDVNGAVTAMEYDDPLLRPTKVTTAYGTSLAAQTTTEYGAGTSASTRYVKVSSQIDATNWKQGYQWFDGLGRTVRTQSVDPAGDVYALTCYDNMGRVSKASNPFRNWTTQDCATTTGMEWTSNTFDTAGRPWKVITPDSAYVETTYGVATSGSAIGTTVTVADQAGKLRRSVTNALGQLIRIDEPNSSNQLGTLASPNQATYYTYNTNGQMIRVQQGGQDRYFMYDSLGRTLRVRQPEQEVNTALNTSGNPNNNSWTSGFTYDNNGNVLTTTDAKGTTITSTYDALNRPLTRTYSDGTPTVTNYYDGLGLPSVPNYSKGKLTRVSSSVSDSRYTAFDVAGRLTESKQITDGNTYTSLYQYNLAGALTQETLPSGRVVKNSFSTNGDLSLVETKPSGGSFTNRASDFTYSPDGKIKQLKLGNGLWETAQFNNRLQVTEFALGTTQGGNNVWKANYDYGELHTNGTVDATKNSGNIAKQTVTFSGLANPFVQGYKYDPLDRITEAKETVNGNQTWIQNWSYDTYGNRSTFSQNVFGYTSVSNPTIDTATNRFSGGQGYTFDKNGNVVGDDQARSFTYNGDNKQTEAYIATKGGPSYIGQYYYDGEGKRVKKVTGSETTIFVYANGKLIEERNASTNALQTSYIYAGSQLLATETGGTTNYTATDQLGSPRVITDQAGAVVSRRDFMPFGEELFADGTYRKTTDRYSTTGQDIVRQRFTGYQKDAETGLDFAEARYYQNQHGRFTAVDPLLSSGKSANPQTFNRYVYTMNRPLILTDSTGLQAGSNCKGNGACGNIPDPPKLNLWVEVKKDEKRDLSKKEQKIVDTLVKSNWPIIYNAALNVATREDQPKTEVTETTTTKESTTGGEVGVSKQPGVTISGSTGNSSSETEKSVPSLEDSLGANKNYINNNAIAISELKEQGTISNGTQFVGIVNGLLRSEATTLVNQASQSPRLPDEQYVKDKANEQLKRPPRVGPFPVYDPLRKPDER